MKKSIIDFLGWELVDCGRSCESDIQRIYQLELTFLQIDGSQIQVKQHVNGINEKFIITGECVIVREKGQCRGENPDSYMTHQELIDFITDEDSDINSGQQVFQTD